MARPDKDNTLATAAVIGGGAALAWFFWRGRGGGGRAIGDVAPAAPPAKAPPPPPCRVRIRQRAIELNGAPADLQTTIDACRAAGTAELTATGDAVVGVIAETGRALGRAGVRVTTTPDLRPFVDDEIGSASR